MVKKVLKYTILEIMVRKCHHGDGQCREAYANASHRRGVRC